MIAGGAHEDGSKHNEVTEQFAILDRSNHCVTVGAAANLTATGVPERARNTAVDKTARVRAEKRALNRRPRMLERPLDVT